ncbi:hypothetical protein [Streptomyces sp. UG1]|uniref:hypothetical protein n=1 Tax=Streptomyces sp. UG1 TaxID=3417652 RepID=UPI003CE9CF61
MSVVMSMRWAGATPEQYDAARQRVRWEEQPPPGIVLHEAWFEDDGMHVIDVWESQADWDRFLTEQIMPAVKDIGMPGEPEYHISPLHRRFVSPGVSGSGT